MIKYYSQLRVKGGRITLGSTVLPKIRQRVEQDARHFHVSKSFVVATALAEVFNIKEQEDYHTVSRRKKNGKLSKR